MSGWWGRPVSGAGSVSVVIFRDQDAAEAIADKSTPNREHRGRARGKARGQLAIVEIGVTA